MKKFAQLGGLLLVLVLSQQLAFATYNPNPSSLGASDGSARDVIYIDSSANVGVGDTTPGAKLHVNGTIMIEGGTPGAGKVLTSDATGLASWTTIAASLEEDTEPDLGANLNANGYAITSDTGAISFSDENLTTTGIINGATLVADSKFFFQGSTPTVGQALTASATNGKVAWTSIAASLEEDTEPDLGANLNANGYAITSDTGAISFDDENLTTTGTINGANLVADSKFFFQGSTPSVGQALTASATNGKVAWTTISGEVAGDNDPDLSAALDANGYGLTDVGDIALDSLSSAAGTSIAVTLGTDAGDDLLINGNTLVIEGDNSQVGINDSTPDYLLDVNGTLGVAGAASIGNNSATVAIDSSDWDISATGAMTGIGAITSDGAISTSSTLAVTGNTTLGANLVMTPSATANITAGGGITVANAIMQVQGSGGAVNITANPQIVDGTHGQIVVIVGQHATNTVTFDDGTGLSLVDGASFTLGLKDTLTLIYDSGNDVWIEISRSDRQSDCETTPHSFRQILGLCFC